MTDQQSRVSAAEHVNNLLRGAWVARAIHVAVELDLPDLLADGPVGCAVLAATTGADETSLRKLLRLLASVGIFAGPDEDSRYRQTPLSQVLRADPASPVATDARFQSASWHWRAWEQLGYSIRTGEDSFEFINGASFWKLTREDAKAGELFAGAMGSVAIEESKIVPAVYDFAGSLDIVDVGGGAGSLLSEVLLAAPRARGRLLDRHPAVAEAEKTLAARGLSDRAEVITGDFFQEVPSGADTYLIKHVLHDWTDDEIVQILRRIGEAMPADGKLLLMDNMVDESSSWSDLAADMLMLVLVGGGDRSQPEYRALVTRAGLRVDRAIPTGNGSLWILEVRHGQAPSAGDARK